MNAPESPRDEITGELRPDLEAVSERVYERLFHELRKRGITLPGCDTTDKALAIIEQWTIDAAPSHAARGEPRFSLQIDSRIIDCDTSHKVASDELKRARIHGPDVRTIDALEEALGRAKAAERDFMQVHKNCIAAREEVERLTRSASEATIHTFDGDEPAILVAASLVKHYIPANDLACARCRPHSDVLVAGFVCSYHRAEDALR